MIPEIAVRTEGPVYRVELNRPDCGNLVTTEMVAMLSDAVGRLPDEAKLLVLTGRGAEFCKGRDYQAALDRLTAKGLGYLVYSTADVDARAALAMGLASGVVPDGELSARADKLVETISSQPLDAVRAVKEYLKFAPLMEPRGRADFAASLIAGVLSSR